MKMALYSLLRRASSSLVPLAIRASGSQSQRSFHAIPSLILRRQFSSLKRPADQNLLNVLQSEIHCADEVEVQNTAVKIPENFDIKDNPGERTVVLSRKIGSETVTIEADIPNLSMEVEGEDDDEDDGVTVKDPAPENSNDSSIPLVVSVTKPDGLQLEFGITAFPGEFTIDSLSIKKPDTSDEHLAYEGPEFGDLDENFQKAFYNYLEVRGIDSTTTSFLHEYMVAKEGREYVNWLNNLKDFVEH